MKRILIVLSLLTAFAAQAQTGFEIINGKPVDAAHPLHDSVAGLLFKSGGVWLQGCTASVLSSRIILTAAHCVRGQTPANVTVNFSLKSVTYDQQMNPATRVSDLGKVFTVRSVKGLKIHPSYDGSGKHDLALIALTADVPASAKPVTLLPEALLDRAAGRTAFEGQSKDVRLMGFGIINEQTEEETDVLRETVVPARFEDNLVVTDQTHGSGGCFGDSGGPAFLTHEGVTYQVGVTHGPHAGSQSCHEEGEWVNPALDSDFLKSASVELLAEPQTAPTAH